MTLLFADGFEGYTTGGDKTVLDTVYDYHVTNPTHAGVAGTGRISGKCGFSLNGFYNPTIVFGHNLVLSTLSSSSTWIIGFAMKCDENFYGANFQLVNPLVQFVESSLTLPSAAMLSVDIAGSTLNVVTGQANTGPKLCSGGRLLAKRWHYVELKVFFHASTGTVELRVDGEVVGSGTGQTTAPDGIGDNTPTYVSIGGSVFSRRVLFDDFYVCDSAGSVNNTFLGDIGIRRLDTTADGTTNNFTPLAGTNWEAVDEDDPDGDDTYVESSTVGHIDLYAIDDAGVTPAAINALQVISTGKKDDASAKGGRNRLLSGASSATGPTYALTTGYVPYQSLHETDPNTGVAWTEAGVDAVEVGVEVVS